MREWSGIPPRVLVVGWGFLGDAVGRRLAMEGAIVNGLTRSESPRVLDARSNHIEMVIGDARDWDTMHRSIETVDHVVYVAGGLDPPTAALHPLDDAVGTLSPLLCTLDAVRARVDVSFTYISSGGAVYGNPAHVVAVETDQPQPISAYGVSRFAGESYTHMYATTFGIAARIVRCANVYGPGQAHSRPQGAVAVFLHRVSAGLAVTVFGDGTSIRDYVHVDDVASAIAQLVLLRIDCGIVNVGSGSGRTVVELLDAVAETVGRAPVTEFVPRRPHDVDAIVLDIAKLRSLVAFDPVAMNDGVRATWHTLAPAG